MVALAAMKPSFLLSKTWYNLIGLIMQTNEQPL
jgi:hypothetical protein